MATSTKGNYPNSGTFLDELGPLGPRVLSVLANMSDAERVFTLPREPRRVWQAARADGEEFMKKKEYKKAVASFEFAFGTALKFPELFGPSDLAKVRVEAADAHVKLKNYSKALDILRHSVSVTNDIPEGYMLLSKTFLEMGDSVSASCSLLDGMEKCQLSEEQQLDIITTAAILLADLKLSVISGQHSGEQILSMRNFSPKLPTSRSLWNVIIQRLWHMKALAGLAFITSGLPGPAASILENAAVQYECSYENLEIHVIFETLSQPQLKGWGNLLALFILEHGGVIRWQPDETAVIALIKYSLKSGSVEILKEALKGEMDIDGLDECDISGNTALHFLVKSQPFTSLHKEMVKLLVAYGALANVLDLSGKIPLQYVVQTEEPSIFQILCEPLQKPNEGFRKRISRLKAKGNAAHRNKDHGSAMFFYQVAINLIEASRYDMRRDVAILYSNMAAEYARVGVDDKVFLMAEKSRNADPAFHKPYWRLGKGLIDKGKIPEACDTLMKGLACDEVDQEQRLQFLQEICNNLSALSENEANTIVSKMASFLPDSWPKLVEALSKTASAKSWDIIRCLVLGPPEKTVAKASVNPGWKYADRFSDGEKLKVGYAMCLKAQTPVLSTLMEVVEGNEGSEVHEWATDLTLALLLHGADLSSLATSDEETGYHVALHMCCHTEKLGLLRFLLSEAPHLEEAKRAVTKEARTLLHAACLEFGIGSHPVGQELVKLLLHKGFDPSCKDMMQKTAIQYVNPNSPIGQLLSSSKVTNLNPKSAKEFKELGNSEFKKGNYLVASQCYSQAIDVVKQGLPPLDGMAAMIEYEEEKHELAILFSNRAECYLKMDKVEEALNDAKESVSWDGHWYRGHLRVARALQRKNKTKLAIKAYCNAYNALDETATEAQQKEVLKEMIKTLITVPSEKIDRGPNLGFVPAQLWAKIAYDFLCEAVEKYPSGTPSASPDVWDAANLAYNLFTITPPPNPCLSAPIRLNLKKLCSWYLAQKAVGTAMDLIFYLLLCGSDHTTLSFYEGDTYIHGALFVTILSGNTKVLDWTMTVHGIPKGEVSLQDRDGNTALHIMAYKHHPPNRIPPPSFDLGTRWKMCEFLLKYGINPGVKNNQGQTALDCLEPKCDRRLRHLLETVTKRAMQAQTQATPAPVPSPSTSASGPKQTRAKPTPEPSPTIANGPKQTGESPPPQPSPSATASEPCVKQTRAASVPAPSSSATACGPSVKQTQATPATKQPQTSTTNGTSSTRGASGTSATNNTRGGSGTGGSSTNSNPMESVNKPKMKQRSQCDLCKDYLAEAKSFFSEEKTKIAYSRLLSILHFSHRDQRHESMVSTALDIIAQQLTKSLSPDIPDALINVSQSHLVRILETLAARDKWRQLEAVVSKARANDVPLGQFGRNMSIPALITDKSLCGAESQRVQILNLLVASGAQLPSSRGKEVVSVAVQYNEFHLVERLIEVGADPQGLSLEDGDTPLHAALTVALEKEKGYFGLLEKLLDWFKKDPEKYPFLNPGSTDAAGNTLLHAATQVKYTKHSHKAVEMLVSLGVPVSVRNSKSMLPIDNIKMHNDRRAQYLRVASMPGGNYKQEQKNSAAERDTKPKSKSPEVPAVPPTSSEKHRQVEEKPTAKHEMVIDNRSFKVKTAIEMLKAQVSNLKEIISAEAKVAKTAKERWLEITRPAADDMDRYGPLGPKRIIVIGDKELEASESTSSMVSDESQKTDVQEEEADEEEQVGDSEDTDLPVFDNLEWEVECTSEVWKAMRDKHVPQVLKQRVVKCIYLLARGEWKPALCLPVQGVPETLKLCQARFAKGMRILWELAIAFSPRLSEEAEKRINEDRQEELAVRGGRIYTEIIRVWDIVFQHQKIGSSIQRIIQSHRRGEDCLIQKKLRGVKNEQFQGGLTKRYPMLFAESDVDQETLASLTEKERKQVQLYPPASANELEFHILKFYCFSSALVYNVLKNIDIKIDFPFRVTDREHAVINLRSKTPILLLGRSGTGKTTCCLYRLWSRFLAYWGKCQEMNGDRWLPRTVQYAAVESSDAVEGGPVEENPDPNAEIFEGLDEGGDGDPTASSAMATVSKEPPDVRSGKRGSARDFDHPETKEGLTSISSGHSLHDRGEGSNVNESGEDNEEQELEGGATALQSHVVYDHLHQLFVTKNQVLCSEVQKNFRELCHADELAAHHIMVEDSPLPHRLQDIDEYKYPLFLTSRQLILMLDASLPPPHFFERNEDGSLKVTIEGWGADEEIFAFMPLDDDSDEEEEYYDDDEEDEDGQRQEDPIPVPRARKKDNRREVTYEVFAHEVWPRIIKKAKVDYHPSLVWTEITSFIKGSFEALMQPSGYLDKDRYENLGRKQAPNFTGSRDQVYKLFLAYNHYKRQHNLYDESDLMFHIYKRLKTAEQLPWVLHEVFVDETQDFTQAELTVLIRLAHNPNDMFLTGDTAQSIMRGVSFRFSDLKTLFFYAKQSLKARGKTRLLEVPKQVYQLTHNYRSHAGILSLASAVLDILVEFFPESFDHLQKDQGLFHGPKPVVLESCKPADLAVLLSGNKRKTSHIEFGAHQVILVVNEEARNNLPADLSLGLVLTIFEAKGLEFDDVLLYNFFKDSQASKEWRVVTDFLERLSRNEISSSCASATGLVEISQDFLQQPGRSRPLHFDPNQHKILNSELKQLYTALTRARVNVWIFDEDEDSRKPMFEYFKALNLVRFITVGEKDLEESMFAEESSKEDWEKRGDEIMDRSLYRVAAKCYEIAGAHQKQNIAIAHQMALEASQMRGHAREMREAFLKAAISFLQCLEQLPPDPGTLVLRFNLAKKAGLCLQNAREVYLAAQVFEKNGLMEFAGPLYVRAREWLEASHCYEQLDNFNRAVKILDEHEKYDEAIDCLQRYNIRRQEFEKRGQPCPRALVDHKPDEAYTLSSLCYKSAKLFHRLKNPKNVSAAVDRMPNVEDQISFLKTYGYYREAAERMCSQGQFSEAAHMMLHNGEMDEALRIAEKGEDNAVKAHCYLLKAQKLMARKNKEKPVSSQTEDETRGKPLAMKSGGSREAGLRHISPAKDQAERAGEAHDNTSSSFENDTLEGDVQQEVLELLQKARNLFDICKNRTGVGECLLTESLLRLRDNLVIEAYNNFSKTEPCCNTAGILECTEVLRQIAGVKDLRNCCRLVSGIESVYKAVEVLLKPVSVEDKNCFQMYLKFYGLEVAENDRLAFHPKQKPRCVQMAGAENLFSSKDERKKDRLEKPAHEVCLHLSKFLLTRMEKWKTEAEEYIQKELPRVIHCHSFQEGQICDDEQFCPYLHGAYDPSSTESAVDLLSCHVRLDHAVQSGAESLSKINDTLYEIAADFITEDHKWGSMERLLEFLLPAGLPTYSMNSVVDFCFCVQKRLPKFEGVFRQVRKYLTYHWEHPGRVGRGKSRNVVKERCKSTDWIVLAAFLAPLLKLEIDVDKLCTDLEKELSNKQPPWVRKLHKYALLTDGGYVVLLARRHLDALSYLHPDKFDPFESLIKFTKFTKLLGNRGEVGLIPDFRIFFFWLEVFTTLAFCLAAKIKGNGHMILPDCYDRNLRMVNLNFPASKGGNLHILLERLKLKRNQGLPLLHDRVKALVGILSGFECRRRFSLVVYLARLQKKTPNTYLLLERGLVLELVLLLNIEQGNAPDDCEVPILQSVHAIREEEVQSMPSRLACLIRGVKEARSYRDIAICLDASLKDMSVRLRFCQWRWNEEKKYAIFSRDINSMYGGGTFIHFDKQLHGVKIPQAQSYAVNEDDSDDQDVDNIDGGGSAEKVEELDEDEKVNYNQKMKEAKHQEMLEKSASKIFRFLKALRFRTRIRGLNNRCILQVEKELFASSSITSAMCGVCGIRFEKAALADLEDQVVHGEGMEEEVESQEAVQKRLKQEHLASDEHRRNETECQTFRQMYRSQIAMPLFNIRAFLSKCQVKKKSASGTEQWNPIYQDIPYHLETLTTLLQSLSLKLQVAIQERRWTQRKELSDLCHDLLENCRQKWPIIQQHFDEHEMAVRQQAEAWDREEQHHERLMEDMVEDSDIDEKMIRVVDQPAQHAPHHAGGAGRSSGGGRTFRHVRGRGRGRGRVWDRGHGWGHDGGFSRNPGHYGGSQWRQEGQHRGSGERDIVGQFEKGDLPPRFKR